MRSEDRRTRPHLLAAHHLEPDDGGTTGTSSHGRFVTVLDPGNLCVEDPEKLGISNALLRLLARSPQAQPTPPFPAFRQRYLNYPTTPLLVSPLLLPRESQPVLHVFYSWHALVPPARGFPCLSFVSLDLDE